MSRNQKEKKQEEEEEEDYDDQDVNLDFLNIAMRPKRKNNNNYNFFDISQDNKKNPKPKYKGNNFNDFDSNDNDDYQEMKTSKNHQEQDLEQDNGDFDFLEKTIAPNLRNDVYHYSNSDKSEEEEDQDSEKQQSDQNDEGSDSNNLSDINIEDNIFKSDSDQIKEEESFQEDENTEYDDYSEEDFEKKEEIYNIENEHEKEEEEEEEEENDNNNLDEFDFINQSENEENEEEDHEDISNLEDEEEESQDDDEDEEEDKNQEDQNQDEEDEEDQIEDVDNDDDFNEDTEKLKENAILNTINSILSDEFHFNDILEAIKIENFLIFLKKIFDNGHDLGIIEDIEEYQGTTEIQKMNEIIEFLGKKKAIFKILKFNFSDPEMKKNSSILMYTKILDLFYLKQTKQEMLDRCETLLFTRINKEDTLYEMKKKILLNWNTYLALVYFTNETKIHFNKEEASSEDYSFEKKKIPKIIDENYLNKIKVVTSPLFYQLQFIFNELDKQDFCHYFVESYLITLKRLNKVKVPEFSAIAASMIPKKIALTEQSIKSDKTENSSSEEEEVENSKLNNNDDDDEDNSSTEAIKEKYKIDCKIYQSFRGIDLVERNPFDEMATKPRRVRLLKYKNRKSTSTRLLKSRREKKCGKMIDAEDFWSTNYENYEYDNGILVTSLNKKVEAFDASVNHQKKELFDMKKQFNLEIVKFICKEHQETKFELFKFFIYDENKMKWEKNDASIDSFMTKMKIDVKKDEVPLIFYSNSNEKDLITLNSNLIQKLYPDFNDKVKDDQIFVYALYGKALKLFYKMQKKICEELRNPIYLLLHVPESKHKLKNLPTIIFQIYYFLSFICDIEIVILNRDNYRDQIFLLDKFNNIKRSYKNLVNAPTSIKFIQSLIFLHRSIAIKNKYEDDDDEDEKNDKNNNNDDIVCSSDGDENQEDELDEFLNDEILSNDIFIDMNLNIFKKEPNFILLVNSDNVIGNGYFKKIDQSKFFLQMKEFIKYKNCSIHFINVNDPSTYIDFLNSLNNFIFKSEFFDDDIMTRLGYYKMSQMSGFYIQYKFISDKEDKSYLSKLKSKINKRFIEYKDHNFSDKTDLYLLNLLNKELIKSYPSIDIDYSRNCNSIINEIKDEKAKKYQRIIKKELGKSSANSIDFWTVKINKKVYLSNDIKDNIKSNHEEFLKNEFFDIISDLFPKKDLSYIFVGNESILNDQIKIDNDKFKRIFDDFDENLINEKYQKVDDFADQKDKGTNYMIRERENVRELKIIVESGKLEDEIENDY